MGAACANAKMA